MRDLYIEPVSTVLLDFINQAVFDASDTVWWNQGVPPLGCGVMKSWMEAASLGGVVLNVNDVCAFSSLWQAFLCSDNPSAVIQHWF